jgi:nucleoside-diphosphate-sugar epimerase
MSGGAPDVLSRIAITGSSGLYGRSLIAEIRRRLPTARILGIDLRSAEGDPPDEFHHGDITAPRQAEAVGRFGPDTLVHLAYAVQPGRDAAALRATNIDGTRAVLDVAAAVQPRRLLVASSAHFASGGMITGILSAILTIATTVAQLPVVTITSANLTNRSCPTKNGFD